MTKEELIEVCQEIINKLNEKIEEPPVDYKFYNDFVRNYNTMSIKGLTKIPYIDLAAAIIYIEVDYESMIDVIENVKSFEYVLEELSSEELDHAEQIFSGFVKSGKGHILEAMFDDIETDKTISKLNKFFKHQENEQIDESTLKKGQATINKLVLKSQNPGWNTLNLVRYYRDAPAGLHNIIAIIRMLKRIEEEKLDYTAQEFKDNYDVDNVLKVCSAINMTKKVISDDYKKYKTRVLHEISIYKKFQKNIETVFQKEEIKNYEAIVHDLDDEDLKCAFLRLVCEHNKEEYDKVEVLNEELKKNSITNYIAILKAYNIRKDEVDLSRVMRNSCDDLEKMLKVLNGVVGDRDAILRIIEYSDLDNVNYFKELKSNSILGNSIFIKYPDIFDITSEHRKMLDENIKNISNYNLDFALFNKYPDVLTENDKLESNLEILKEYSLLYNLCNTRKLKFLKNDNLIEVIDKIIELGYEEFLNDGLDLLNEKNWDRIYVLKSMGLKPETKEELLKYLRDDKFFIPDNQLDLYTENVTKYYEDLGVSYDSDIKRIVEDYSITSRALNFNGVIISKNRVVRNLTSDEFNINDFFKAIITGSILTTDEINTIKKNLKNKIYIKD